MAYIDYGSILKVNGKFINKNGDLFMESSDTGYICDRATYFDEYAGREDVMDVAGNYYVYAGDEKFMLCFYKGTVHVISNNRLICSRWNIPFVSETIYLDGFPSIKIEYLDKNMHVYPVESVGTWKEYVKENWRGATGNEKISDLQDGHKRYKRFQKMLRKNAREKKNPSKWYKYRTNRYLATWEYNGNKYEVIFGYGIDPSEKVWNDIKNDSYDFTDTEREIIDKWFGDE